jgi:integrase
MKPATISVEGGRWLRAQKEGPEPPKGKPDRRPPRFPGATLHRLRHSIGTQLRRNGTDLEVISVFLGHSSIETTRIYTRGAEPQIAAEVRRLPDPRSR